MHHSIVLPPSSNLTASPLHQARRVQRAHGLTAGTTSGLARSAYHANASANATVAATSTPVAAAATPLPSAPSMAHATAPTAAPAAAAAAAATSAPPRQSMGLFAHMATQSNSSGSAHLSLSSEERWDGRPSGPGGAPGEPAPTAAELARIYVFMDEAQSRTAQLERQVEEQKEVNRVLLISSSQRLIALQERADALLFDNAQMADELAQLTTSNRQMVAQAQAQAQAQAHAQAQAQTQAQQGATQSSSIQLPAGPAACTPARSCASLP